MMSSVWKSYDEWLDKKSSDILSRSNQLGILAHNNLPICLLFCLKFYSPISLVQTGISNKENMFMSSRFQSYHFAAMITEDLRVSESFLFGWTTTVGSSATANRSTEGGSGYLNRFDFNSGKCIGMLSAAVEFPCLGSNSVVPVGISFSAPMSSASTSSPFVWLRFTTILGSDDYKIYGI